MIEAILVAVVVSAGYALLGYAKNVGTDFDLEKYGATVILGTIIGVILYSSGTPITEAVVVELMAVHVGLLCIIENGLKALYRRVRPFLPLNES